MSVFPANATLTFQVSTGAKEFDELGIPRAVLQPLVVRAYLKEKSGRSTSDDASDRHEIRFEGRCVEPATLPATLQPGSIAVATIGKLQGEFTLAASGQSAYEAITEVLGEKLKGSFSARVLWGQGDV